MDMLILFRRATSAKRNHWFGFSCCFILIVLLAACSSASAEPEEVEAAAEPQVSNPTSLVEEIDPEPAESNAGQEELFDDQEGGFTVDAASSIPSTGNNPDDESEQVEEALELFPSLSLEEENLHLESALAMIPDDALNISFTQWNRLKRRNRVPEMTSTFPFDDRRRFIVQVLKGNQAASIMDKEFIDVQANLWGWDSTDLVWEIEARFEDILGTINILRIRPNLDLTKLSERLLEENFSEVDYRGFTIYSLSLLEKTEWYNISPLSIHNVVILPEENIIILSPVLESVQKALDVRRETRRSFLDDPLVRRTAFPLIGMASVEMYRGEETCQYFSAGMSDNSRIINAASDQLVDWPVSPYQLMALGHTYVDEEQADLVLFHYNDFRQAEADFEFRGNLLRFGTSPKKNVPYSAQFILQDEALDDALMTFSLIPSPALSDRPGWPQTVIGWVQNQDALFASCVVEDFLGLDEMR